MNVLLFKHQVLLDVCKRLLGSTQALLSLFHEKHEDTWVHLQHLGQHSGDMLADQRHSLDVVLDLTVQQNFDKLCEKAQAYHFLNQLGRDLDFESSQVPCQ